jgi:hypothetical protein
MRGEVFGRRLWRVDGLVGELLLTTAFCGMELELGPHGT